MDPVIDPLAADVLVLAVADIDGPGVMYVCTPSIFGNSLAALALAASSRSRSASLFTNSCKLDILAAVVLAGALALRVDQLEVVKEEEEEQEGVEVRRRNRRSVARVVAARGGDDLALPVPDVLAWWVIRSLCQLTPTTCGLPSCRARCTSSNHNNNAAEYRRRRRKDGPGLLAAYVAAAL